MIDWEKYLLRIDPQSPTPIYAQLVDEMKRAVARGRWIQGQKIPSVRELAVKLGINPNTVAKSYDMLVDEGILAVHRGIGVFVAAAPQAAEKRRDLGERLERLAGDALSMGVSRPEFDKLCERAVRKVYER